MHSRSSTTNLLLPPRPSVALSYDRIAAWVDAKAPELRLEAFVAIVAILRGGLFPAQCCAFATGAPLHFLRYDRTTQTADWLGPPPATGRLLVCEDIAGSGHTLLNCLAMVRTSHPDFMVLTVLADEYSRTTPNWSMRFPGKKTVLPWEREGQSPQFMNEWYARQTNGANQTYPDHSYRYIGIDFDGVLCDEMPAIAYATNLASCLRQRDELSKAAYAPQLDSSRHVLITGRPLEDRDRTETWLRRHRFPKVQIHFRDSDRVSDAIEEVARYKGSTADRLGCTDFVESCPTQATLIALHFPHLRVYAWRNGEPSLVTATPTLGPFL